MVEVYPAGIVDEVLNAELLALAGMNTQSKQLKQNAYFELRDSGYGLCQILHLFVNARDMTSQAEELGLL